MSIVNNIAAQFHVRHEKGLSLDYTSAVKVIGSVAYNHLYIFFFSNAIEMFAIYATARNQLRLLNGHYLYFFKVTF